MASLSEAKTLTYRNEPLKTALELVEFLLIVIVLF